MPSSLRRTLPASEAAAPPPDRLPQGDISPHSSPLLLQESLPVPGCLSQAGPGIAGCGLGRAPRAAGSSFPSTAQHHQRSCPSSKLHTSQTCAAEVPGTNETGPGSADTLTESVRDVRSQSHLLTSHFTL